MRILLDTNVCIAIMRGAPKAVARMSEFGPGDCGVSTITAYELFTGVSKCRDSARERTKVERLLGVLTVIPFDELAALHAGRVRAELEQLGLKCGPYDLLLAGHALALGVPFATHNVREFARVGGLQVEDWL